MKDVEVTGTQLREHQKFSPGPLDHSGRRSLRECSEMSKKIQETGEDDQ